MRTLIRLLSVSAIGTSLLACTDVSFAPGVEEVASHNNEEPIDPKVTESFFFDSGNTEKYVDVLFIVDNSTSMIAEQEKLGERLNSFVSSLSEVDWQIGITTSDASNGTYGIKGSLLALTGASGYILRDTTPNYASVFRNSVVRHETLECQTTGICPTSNEQPLLAAMMAMEKRDHQNAGFFRNDADLAIVILSDEDEMSSGPLEATKPQAVVNHFQSIWGTEKNLSVYAIVVEPGNTDCYSKQYITGGTYATHATELVQLTGGVTGSICDTDYSQTLSKIGEKVNNLLNYVVLKSPPLAEGLEVVTSPYDPELTWTIKGRRVIFNKTPQEGTRVDVIYQQK